MATGVLLGPQRLAVTVDRELTALNARGINGPIAAITAGWQEREAEDQELQAALGNRAINLSLHVRGDAVFLGDPELTAMHRAKQDRLRHLQNLYRGRLAHAVAAVAELQIARGPSDLIESEIAAAIEAIRLVDRQHLGRVEDLNREYEASARPSERGIIQDHRQALADILARCCAVAIAGGHVASLLNRLRLFDLGPLIADKPILAWSAGAMTLTDRVILFHDNPPQGRGNAEILDAGLGLFPGMVVLPHARRRLLLNDRDRVSLFARRFAPAVSVALDERCSLHFDGERYCAGESTHALRSDGVVSLMEPTCR
ncbi:MAG: Type 1 glutamine amidotransferase-like domain-containing protein [Nannocystaceae bacterium]